jgi:hypothetical protein
VKTAVCRPPRGAVVENKTDARVAASGPWVRSSARRYVFPHPRPRKPLHGLPPQPTLDPRQDIAVPSQITGKRRKADGMTDLSSHNRPDLDPSALVLVIARTAAGMGFPIVDGNFRVSRRFLASWC